MVSDSYTDAALNLGGSGSDSVTRSIGPIRLSTVSYRLNPALSDGTASSLVTFTFSEAPVGFSEADLDVVGGTITGLAATVDPLVWTAQFIGDRWLHRYRFGGDRLGQLHRCRRSIWAARAADSVTIDRTNPTVDCHYFDEPAR